MDNNKSYILNIIGANDQGIPIYTVNQANIATILPQLQIDQQVKTDIQNAVNSGKVVMVSKTNINFNWMDRLRVYHHRSDNRGWGVYD